MRRLEGKRGAAQRLISFIFYILFALFILSALLFFVNKARNGDLIKEQILAKQIALLLDAAEPGTTLTILTDGFIVIINQNTKTILVKASEQSSGYSYDFFSTNKIDYQSKNNYQSLEIKIS